MKLTIKERIQLSSMLPKQAGMIEMILVREMTQRITLTSKEIEEYKIIENEKGIFWTGDIEIDVEFNPSEIKILKESVKKFDEDKLITLDNLDLCVKINNLLS